jgi:hypothetical protein
LAEDIPQVKSLMSASLKCQMGLPAILERIHRAVQGLYFPRSYAEKEYHLAQVLYRLGGVRAAHIAHHGAHLPSLTVIKCKARVLPLVVSSGYLTVAEITKNFHSMFEGAFDVQERLPAQIGHVIMLDEIATEQHLRYDAVNNTILGPCREHTKDYVLKFESEDQAKLIFEGIRAESLHISSEVSYIVFMIDLTNNNVIVVDHHLTNSLPVPCWYNI